MTPHPCFTNSSPFGPRDGRHEQMGTAERPRVAHQNFAAGSAGRAGVWIGLGHHPVVLTDRWTAARDIPDTGIPPAMAARMTMAEQYDWHRAFLRRHRVSRPNFLRGSAAVAAAAALGLSPFGRRAQDAPVAVANWGVGYGADASSQLRLCAQLSRNPSVIKIFVDHGPTPALG